MDIRELENVTEWHNAFDAGVLVEVIEHVPPEYHRLLLDNMHRVLRPGGTLIATVPSLHIRGSRWHYKHFSLEEIKNLITEAGFKVEQCLGQNRLHPILYSRRFWRLFRNKKYDLIFMRRWVTHYFLRHLNVADVNARVGRYVVVARKPEK